MEPWVWVVVAVNLLTPLPVWIAARRNTRRVQELLKSKGDTR